MARTVTIGGEEYDLSGKAKNKVDVTSDNVSYLNKILENAYGVTEWGSYFIERFNNGDSVGRILNDIREGTIDKNSAKAVAARNSYTNTFLGMDEFRKQGGAFFGMSQPERAYLSYKNTVIDTLKQYKVDVNKFGSAEKIKQYIMGNANAQVIAQRIQMADAAVSALPQSVKSVFSEYYNIQPTDLVNYYLDTTPETETELMVKERAARIGQEAIAQGYKQAGSTRGISVSAAEEYAKAGVTAEQAQRAFSEIQQQMGLTSGFGESVTQTDLENAALKNDATAIKKIKRVSGSRAAEFQKGGGFIDSQRGVSGLGSSSS